MKLSNQFAPKFPSIPNTKMNPNENKDNFNGFKTKGVGYVLRGAKNHAKSQT